MPELGGGGHLADQLTVNPIPTGEGRLSPPITTDTPNVFHLPASLCINLYNGEKKVLYKQVSCSYANKHIVLYNNYDHIIESSNYIIDYRKQYYVAIMNLSREFELT
jgi:hypothetical protein